MLRAVLNILVRNASTRGPMCFRCLIFNLSGPCELLFLLCFIASWTDTCTSEVHPVFNPVAPYGYPLSDMYLFMADITNPDFLV